MANQEIIANHDACDRAEQSGTANQPAENVRTVTAEKFPRHHGDAEYAGDETSRAERDEVGANVGEIVGRRDNVGRDIGVECGDEKSDQRDECDDGLVEAAKQGNGIPDGFAENYRRGGSDRHADESVKRHGEREDREPGRASACAAIWRSG